MDPDEHKPGIPNFLAGLLIVLIIGFVGLLAFGATQLHRYLAPWERPVAENGDDRPQSGNELGLHYVRVGYNPDSFEVWKFGGQEGDKRVLSAAERYLVSGNYSESERFLLQEGKIRILDLRSGDIRDYHEKKLQGGEYLSSAIRLKNSDVVAYSVNTEPVTERQWKGEIWLHRPGKSDEKVFQRDALQLYTGLQTIGWVDRDRLVVRESGGDGAGYWGKLWLVDTRNKIGTEVRGETDNFFGGKLSPDGRKWLYALCRKPESRQDEYLVSCPDGMELVAYDFGTGESQTIFRNTTHGDNLYKGHLRAIYSYLWSDSDTVLVTIPDGLYRVALVDGSAPQLLYRQMWNSIEVVKEGSLALEAVAGRYVGLKRHNVISQDLVFDLESMKMIEIAARERGSGVTRFLD